MVYFVLLSEVVDLPLAVDVKIEIDEDGGMQGDDDTADNPLWMMEPQNQTEGDNQLQMQPPQSSEDVTDGGAVQMDVHPIQTVNVPFPGERRVRLATNVYLCVFEY